jgi:hypothetical protein
LCAKSNKKGGRLRATLEKSGFYLQQIYAVFSSKASKGGRKQPLFEKSGAKNFFMLGPGRCRRQRPGPRVIKVFLLLFVHKK